MEIRIKNATGAVILLSGLPAFAQDSSNAKSSAVTMSAPAASGVAYAQIPSDPTWFIAGVIVGAGLGVLAAKVFSNKKQ